MRYFYGVYEFEEGWDGVGWWDGTGLLFGWWRGWFHERVGKEYVPVFTLSRVLVAYERRYPGPVFVANVNPFCDSGGIRRSDDRVYCALENALPALFLLFAVIPHDAMAFLGEMEGEGCEQGAALVGSVRAVCDDDANVVDGSAFEVVGWNGDERWACFVLARKLGVDGRGDRVG